MGLCSSREQPRTRVGGDSILLDPLPKTPTHRPASRVGGGVTPTTPRLLPLVRAPLPQRESTTVDLNEAVVGEIAGQRQGAPSRAVARHTGTVSVTRATIELVKPPARLISPLSACNNASRLSATPRCATLWCLADLCRCPVGPLGSACSSGRQGRADHLPPPDMVSEKTFETPAAFRASYRWRRSASRCSRGCSRTTRLCMSAGSKTGC
jgi:hypothetical protein